jgi:hypothetical protein
VRWQRNWVKHNKMINCAANFVFTSSQMADAFMQHIKNNPGASGLIQISEPYISDGHVISISVAEGHKQYVENIAVAYGGYRMAIWVQDQDKE